MRSRTIFAKNLRRLRADSGFSQEELAHRAGINRTYISDIEREVYAASLDVLDKVAKVLEVDPATLITRNTASNTRR